MTYKLLVLQAFAVRQLFRTMMQVWGFSDCAFKSSLVFALESSAGSWSAACLARHSIQALLSAYASPHCIRGLLARDYSPDPDCLHRQCNFSLHICQPAK